MKYFITLLSFFMAFILFEVFLRNTPFSYGLSPVIYDEYIGMWHRKNISFTTKKKCIGTTSFFDERGLVKNNYVYDNQKYDVVILGDSHIEALLVKNENVLHNRLYNVCGEKYNFLNYGLAGTSPTQHLEILKHKVNLVRVKSIIHFVNLDLDMLDVDPNNFDATSRPKVHLRFDSLENYQVIPPRSYSISEHIRDLLGNYELYTYFKKTYYYIKSRLLIFLQLFIPDLYDNNNIKTVVPSNISAMRLSFNMLQIKGAVYQMNKIASEHSIDYIVVVTFDNYYNRLDFKKFLLKYGIKYLDLMMQLKRRDIDTNNMGFSCDAHWNDASHRNIANVLYENYFKPIFPQ